MSVAVVPTGTANIASVLAAFARAGVAATVVESPSQVARSARVVVPGVGSFGAATQSLADWKIREPLIERIGDGRATLLVCIGLQLLAADSEESPDAEGLGVIPDRVRRFSGDLPVPQLGWNKIDPTSGSRLVTPGWAYFANSYRLDTVPPDWSGALADYGGTFVAALEKGEVLACQFHPELSGQWGAAVISRWLTATGETRQ